MSYIYISTAGYARIVLILAFILTFNHPWLAVALYLANVSLDELDGRAARQFNQCTNFGGMLDMVTDRYIYVYTCK